MQAEAAAAAAGDADADGDAVVADAAAAAAADWSNLAPGCLVGARHHHNAGYGAIMDIEGQDDLVGLVLPDQGAKDLGERLGSITTAIRFFDKRGYGDDVCGGVNGAGP